MLSRRSVRKFLTTPAIIRTPGLLMPVKARRPVADDMDNAGEPEWFGIDCGANDKSSVWRVNWGGTVDHAEFPGPADFCAREENEDSDFLPLIVTKRPIFAFGESTSIPISAWRPFNADGTVDPSDIERAVRPPTVVRCTLVRCRLDIKSIRDTHPIPELNETLLPTYAGKEP